MCALCDQDCGKPCLISAKTAPVFALQKPLILSLFKAVQKYIHGHFVNQSLLSELPLPAPQRCKVSDAEFSRTRFQAWSKCFKSNLTDLSMNWARFLHSKGCKGITIWLETVGVWSLFFHTCNLHLNCLHQEHSEKLALQYIMNIFPWSLHRCSSLLTTSLILYIQSHSHRKAVLYFW